MQRSIKGSIMGVAALLAVQAFCFACGQAPISVLRDSDTGDDEVFVFGTDAPPPLIPPGPGAGVWNSERPRPDNVVLARSARLYLATPDARQRYGDEAAGSFLHYFNNDG